MCFSAVASFTTAALLLPLGIYASKIVWLKDFRYLSLTIVPIVFGIQQAIEGMEWLSLEGNQTDMIRLLALVFLFFAYGFWLICPALAMWIIDRRPQAKRQLCAIGLIGFLFGASMYLPLLIHPDWLTVVIRQNSIAYQTQTIYDRFLSRDTVHLIYLIIVLCPLYLSNFDRIRFLAGLIAISMILSIYFFNYAFISIWCFWVAILSLYIVYMVKVLEA